MNKGIWAAIACAAALSSASADVVLYGNFAGATGTTDASVSGTSLIDGSTWNTVQLPTSTLSADIAATNLKASNGSTSAYTFAADFKGTFSVAAQAASGVSTSSEWDWYNNAVAADASVATGNRVNKTITEDQFATYTFGGFDAADTVVIDFVMSRDSEKEYRTTAVTTNGVSIGNFGAADDAADYAQEFSVTFTGDTEYSLDLSRGQTWGTSIYGPTGSAFRVTVIPEPATLGLLGVGAAGMLLIRRKRG